MHETGGRDITTAIVDVLGGSPLKARFVSEIASQLSRQGVPTDRLELALDELESSGRALVREQYCGDPHLVGTDLRIIALVQPRAEVAAEDQPDALSAAVSGIDAVWQRWLADYLANHRCS